MVTRVRKIQWPLDTREQLENLYRYIKNDSLQNAEKVRSKIITSIEKLIENPKRYPRDKYKINNDGSFRSYEIYRYRISYQIKEEEIIILRIRHTQQKPEQH